MEAITVQALKSRICSLPGGRDKEQRPLLLVNVPVETHIEYKDYLIKSINYLLGCFRSTSLRNGLTVIINAVESGWRITRTYIRYISENISKDLFTFLIVLRPDAFWDKQRVEKCIKSENEISVIYIPKVRLTKFVNISQIPAEIGGQCTFYNHEKWIQDRMKVEEWKSDVDYVLVELNEFHQRLSNNCSLRIHEIENALNTSMEINESTKMLVQSVIDSGRELLFLFDENIQKWQAYNEEHSAPQDLLDTHLEISELLNDINKKQEIIDDAWVKMEKSFDEVQKLTLLEEGVSKVTNWILTVGEEMCNNQQQVGFDVASAEELRIEHEMLEMKCWNTYGQYAELSYIINTFPFTSTNSAQHRDLLSQKLFMDFVCRSFATRLEKRRNLLITSLRLFRLVSEYFDRTSEVFETLVMVHQLEKLEDAEEKLKELQKNQKELDAIEKELVKEGEKLSDMLSMPVKNALGGDVNVNYEEEIVNIKDILDATEARKNIFTDSVELQKLTLEKITHIVAYEKDAEQAVQWLNDLFQVVLDAHSQVGCNVQEIQLQKEELQSFQQTAKCTYNFGCQLLNASLTLRQSCKLSLDDHTALHTKLSDTWNKLQNICQEQMTRLRVSVVFHRSVDEYCIQIQDLRDAVSAKPVEDPVKKRERVRKCLISREHLLMEVGRMVRLGRLLRTRLKEPLYVDSPEISTDKSAETRSLASGTYHHSTINLNEDNATAIESISERLSEVTGLAEQLDMALRGAQQDCALSSATFTTATGTSTSSVNNANGTTPPTKKIFDETTTAGVEGWYEKKPSASNSSVAGRVDEGKSDDEFLTASECTNQSRSSSFHTASECGALSPWWELDRSSDRDDIQKEKMVIAVGLPELPNPKTVLKPSPEVPPGKIVHEVTETTHLKVQHSHTLGVSSYVLTSETVKDGKSVVTSSSSIIDSSSKLVTNESHMKYVPPQEREVITAITPPVTSTSATNTDDLMMKQFKESGDLLMLKILELEPNLTLLGDTLAAALELQRAHHDVLLKLQDKQSPVEELLRQADQLILTKKPRQEVYAAMAESLALAWKDVNAHLEQRREILDMNVLYHQKADECKEKMALLEMACKDTMIPIEIDAVKQFLTNIHDMKRNVLEAIMPALQQGNQLLAKLRELEETGTLDSRPEKIKIPCKYAIAQVERWMEELSDQRRLLELSWEKRKTQLEQCLALAFLARDLRELEDILSQRREMLINNDQLGESVSSAEFFLNEHNRLYNEAKELQEKALKITKATEQFALSKCFAGEEATAQAYGVLELTTQYINDLEIRQELFMRAIQFFKSAQEALSNLDRIENELTNTAHPRTTSELIKLHAELEKSITDITEKPILDGYALLEASDKILITDGVKFMIEQLESKRQFLSGLCVAHKEQRKRVLEALSNFLKRQEELKLWLIAIAESFLQGHQDMGSDIKLAQDFLNLHTQLLCDVQEKGTQINTLLLTLPPILEYLEDAERQDVDKKVEALHERWINIKNMLEARLDLTTLYVQFFSQVNDLESAMNFLEESIKNKADRLNETVISKMEEQWLSLKPLYNKLKAIGKQFIDDSNKVTDPHLDTERARLCVETILERLANKQIIVADSWQCWQTELSERREILIQWEKNMTESTKTINWVTKLKNELYPIITSTNTEPLNIVSDLEEKLENVTSDVTKALKEIDERIKTTESLLNRRPSQEIQTAEPIKDKLNDLHTTLTNILAEYKVLVQMIIAYYNNVHELEKTIDKHKTRYIDKSLPHTVHEIIQLTHEHDIAKQAVTEMFKFTQNECDRLISRISNQEPTELAPTDISRILNTLRERKEQWDVSWHERKNILEQHLQLCQFNSDLHQINDTIDDLSKQLQDIKGQYGESLTGAKSTSVAFVYFEKTIELLEDRIQTFIKTAEEMLDKQHIHSPHIEDELRKLKTRWNNFRKQVFDTRKSIDLAIKYFELVEEADKWFKEGNKLLETIARKSTFVKYPEEATGLLNEIEIFLKPGEKKQDERIREISKLAMELFGIESSPQVNKVIGEKEEMLESFSNIINEINKMTENLKRIEEQRQKLKIEQEEALKREQEEANMKLLRAKVEAETAKAAATAAEEARKAAEVAAKTLTEVAENFQQQQQQTFITTTIEKNIVTETQRIIPERIQITDNVTQTVEQQIDESQPPKKILKLDENLQESEKHHVRIIPIEKDEETYNLSIEELPQPERPHFIVPLTDVVIQEGSRFTFECRVSGYPTPTINWFKDGISIENNLDYQRNFDNGICTLTIEETFVEDSAKFTCKATNTNGTAETSAYLSVKEIESDEQLIPPTFLKTLMPACAREGSKFQFKCVVQGNPLPTVQWFKNGECIDNSADYVITYNNGEAILTFEEVFLEDKANYTCKAENPLGVIETTASLAVEPLEPTESPSFSVPLSNVMARAGQKIKLECEFAGIPQPIITWTHNGHPIKETHDVKLICENNKATLLINEAFPKDAGIYLVTATNLAGEATCSSNVTVKGRLPAETSDSEFASDMEPIKPKIQTPLHDTSVFEGSRVCLECVIIGQPEPEVIWYHNDRPVKEAADIKLLFHGDKCTLLIETVYLDDGGEYKVVAINSAGEATSKCKLTVSPLEITEHLIRTQTERILPSGTPPVFTKLLSDILVSEGENVSLECIVTGDPKPDIKWLLNNQEIINDGRLEFINDDKGNVCLKIANVSCADRGVYTVRASNSSGDAKCFSQLIVKSAPTIETVKKPPTGFAPQFIQQLTDKRVTEREPVTFECIVSGSPAPEIKWLLNNEPIVPGLDCIISSDSGKHILKFFTTSPSKQGKITCTAENTLGKSTLQAQLTVSPSAQIVPMEKHQTDISSSFSTVQRQFISTSSHKSSSFMSSTIDGAAPKTEIHSFTTQSHELYKKEGDKPAEQQQIRKTEEFHQKDQAPPVIQKETFVNIEKSDEKLKIEQKPMKKVVAPKFITPVMGRIVDQGADVILEGTVDVTTPIPKITWTRNGQVINEEPGHIIISWNLNKAKLEIKNITSSDAGRYTCTATNDAGSASSTADVIVRKKTFPPVFGRRLQAQLVKKGERVVMEVEVTGLPDPTITWFKDDEKLVTKPGELTIKSQGNCHQIVIEKASLEHSGKYMVRAVNSSGEAQSIADFAVFEPTPETMVEVVKTLVFEDIEKMEKLQSSTDSKFIKQTQETIVPVKLEETVKSDKQSESIFKMSSTPIQTTQSTSIVKFSEAPEKVLRKQHLMQTSKTEEHVVKRYSPIPLPWTSTVEYQKSEYKQFSAPVFEKPLQQTDEIKVEKSMASTETVKEIPITIEKGIEKQPIQLDQKDQKAPMMTPSFMDVAHVSESQQFTQSSKQEISFNIKKTYAADHDFIPQMPVKFELKQDKPQQIAEEKPTEDVEFHPPPVVKQIPTEILNEQTQPEEQQSIIDTSSITKQAAYEFFKSKLEEKIEPQPLESKPSEISHLPQLVQQSYAEFQKAQQAKTSTLEHKEFKEFKESAVKSYVKTIDSTPTLAPIENILQSTSSSETTKKVTQIQEEFNLIPEPPPEISYMPKLPETIKREDISHKIKHLEEVHHEIPTSQVPSGGVKIFPTKVEHKEEKPTFTQHPTFQTSSMTETNEITKQFIPSITPEPIIHETKTAFSSEKHFEETKLSDIERPSSVASTYSSFETLSQYRPQSALSATGEKPPSAEGLAMEKSWAHKHPSSQTKVWPPPESELQKVVPTWQKQEEKKQEIIESKQSKEIKTEYTASSSSQFSEMNESKIISEKIEQPVQHYIANMSWIHKVNVPVTAEYPAVDESLSYETSKRDETIIEESNLKVSDLKKTFSSRITDNYELKSPSIVKQVEPKKQVPPTPLEIIRPISVQDITDEIYLEPGSPPEIAFAEPPRERRLSYVETIEQELEQNLEKGPTKVLPGAIRTIPPPPQEKFTPPPPLPPRKEKLSPAPPLPAKPLVSSDSIFKSESKFVKTEKQSFSSSKFTESDYECDYSTYTTNKLPEPIPPMKFEQPPPMKFEQPPPPSVPTMSEFQKVSKDEKHIFKKTSTTSSATFPCIKRFSPIKRVSPPKRTSPKRGSPPKRISPPLKPGSPPQFLHAEPPKSPPKTPKVKPQKESGYMADVEDVQYYSTTKTAKSYKFEEKHSSKKIIDSKIETLASTMPLKTPEKKQPPLKIEKEFTSPTIVKQYHIETTTERRREERDSSLEPFPFKPDPPRSKHIKCPPPPSPSKFVKGEFRESDFESDYEARIQPIWNKSDKFYKPVRPVLTPTTPINRPQTETKSVTPPTEFDIPPKVDGPPRPKFEPIEKPKLSVTVNDKIISSQKTQTVIKPKPIPAKPLELIVTPGARDLTNNIKPGSPPKISYAPPPPKQTQYYTSTSSVPYYNATQTETSNIVQLNESTESSHRILNIQQTTKVIKFGEKDVKKETYPPFTYQHIEPVKQRRSSVPAPPKPKKFIPGEFRGSDYESEVESAKIRPKWTPVESDTDEPQYRRVRAPVMKRSSSVPTRHHQERVLTPMEFDTQQPLMPSKISVDTVDAEDYKKKISVQKYFTSNKESSQKRLTKESTKMVKPYQTQQNNIKPGSPPMYGYVPSSTVATTATKMASKHMDEMTHTFKSKAQKFVKDVMTDVNTKQHMQQMQQKKPILKSSASDSEAQVYREESRVAEHGTKHVDPDTGLIYFKYDFGYEFGIVLPGVGKNGEIPQPKKTIIAPPKRHADIEVPIIHEKTSSNISNNISVKKSKRTPPSTNNIASKWCEPTSESDTSEFGETEFARRSRHHHSNNLLQPSDYIKQQTSPYITIPTTPSPASLSPSIPSISPAFNNSGHITGAQFETPTSNFSSPRNVPVNRARTPDQSIKPPMFITPLRDIAVMAGNTAKFECIVQAEPPPNIFWTKNGRIIADSLEYQIYYRNGVCRLTIARAYTSDIGTYSCTATNSQGTASTSASLEVPGERRSSYI